MTKFGRASLFSRSSLSAWHVLRLMIQLPDQNASAAPPLTFSSACWSTLRWQSVRGCEHNETFSLPRFSRSLPSRLVSHFGFTLIFTASQTISCFTFPLRIISGAKQAPLSVSGCATASGINCVSLKRRKQPEMSCKARERTRLKLTIELLLAPFSSAFLMQPVIRKTPLWKMSARVWVYLHRDNTQKQVD